MTVLASVRHQNKMPVGIVPCMSQAPRSAKRPTQPMSMELSSHGLLDGLSDSEVRGGFGPHLAPPPVETEDEANIRENKITALVRRCCAGRSR